MTSMSICRQLDTMDYYFPYDFIGFGTMDGHFAFELIGFGAMDGRFPYEFIGWGACFAIFRTNS